MRVHVVDSYINTNVKHQWSTRLLSLLPLHPTCRISMLLQKLLPSVRPGAVVSHAYRSSIGSHRFCLSPLFPSLNGIKYLHTSSMMLMLTMSKVRGLLQASLTKSSIGM